MTQFAGQNTLMCLDTRSRCGSWQSFFYIRYLKITTFTVCWDKRYIISQLKYNYISFPQDDHFLRQLMSDDFSHKLEIDVRHYSYIVSTPWKCHHVYTETKTKSFAQWPYLATSSIAGNVAENKKHKPFFLCTSVLSVVQIDVIQYFYLWALELTVGIF